MKRAFRRPQCTPFELEEIEKKGASSTKDARYYNTRRNGFVSAVAMCYNWHMPLVLDPADIWLLVLQGFRVHLMNKADKEYVSTTFKGLDMLANSNKKLMKITEPSLGDLSACNDAEMEEKLFATI